MGLRMGVGVWQGRGAGRPSAWHSRGRKTQRDSRAPGDGRRALSFFHQKGLQDFDTLLLSGDGNTLYVGAREAILALNIRDPGGPRLKNMIPWPASDSKKSECAIKKSSEMQCFNFIRVLVPFNTTHLYACGTFAFSPACTFIELQDSYLLPISKDQVTEGKGQSPFDPTHKHTAVLVDGMLYSGTMNNFLGSEPILMRTLGSQPVLKTDTFLRWLHRKDPTPIQHRSGLLS
ncbi:semaphorin-4A-like isoform X2 [Carlito syrichta]|uniref:Semaphorin-4A-like isoform X2 n=1 Tax=Carlito syrichta TaxID=1868482 RepID=A0A3Q0E252_CARSF|nr:semaphorin-4A-like isoform X2 [Carlito syrichta]